MGRTNPTYRDQLRRLREDWADYERALRYRDQDAYERLWAHASDRADAAGYANHGRPLDAALLSMLLAQERRIAALEAQRDD